MILLDVVVALYTSNNTNNRLLMVVEINSFENRKTKKKRPDNKNVKKRVFPRTFRTFRTFETHCSLNKRKLTYLTYLLLLIFTFSAV